MRMKALVDGMRSFTFYIAYLFDRFAAQMQAARDA